MKSYIYRISPKNCLTSLRITVPPVNICSVYMYNYCCVYSNLYWWNKLRQTIWVTLPSLSPRVARTSIILFQLPNAMHWLFPKALPYKKLVLTTNKRFGFIWYNYIYIFSVMRQNINSWLRQISDCKQKTYDVSLWKEKSWKSL